MRNVCRMSLRPVPRAARSISTYRSFAPGSPKGILPPPMRSYSKGCLSLVCFALSATLRARRFVCAAFLTTRYASVNLSVRLCATGASLSGRSLKLPNTKEVRGKGFMLGIDIEKDSRSVLEAAINRANRKNDLCGLLILSSGPDTLRLLPPYVITDAEIGQGMEILTELLSLIIGFSVSKSF